MFSRIEFLPCLCEYTYSYVNIFWEKLNEMTHSLWHVSNYIYIVLLIKFLSLRNHFNISIIYLCYFE